MLGKRVFWLAAIVAIAAAAWYRYRADAPASTVLPSKLAFITGGSGDYWNLTVAGAREAADRLKVDIEVRMPDQAESIQQQNQLLTAVGTGDFDGVAVSPLDAEGQVMVINTLASFMPVVTFDSDAPTSARHGFVGTSNFSAGLMAGSLVKRAIPEGGKVAVLMANLTKSNMQDRKEGFKTRIEQSPVPEESAVDPRFEVVGFYTDEGSDEECMENIRQILAEHGDIACLVGMNARHAPLMLKTLREAGKLDAVKLVTFDTRDETLSGIDEGHVFATIAQDPFRYGYDAVNLLVQLCDGENAFLPVVGRGAIHVSVEAITAENLPDFRERLEARKKKAETKPPAAQKT